MVSVEVTNAEGRKIKGSAVILVSVSPTCPVITSVNPSEVREGDQIRITGAGFGNSENYSNIDIAGVPVLIVSSWSDTVIEVIVPYGAMSGDVIVTVSGVKSSPGYIDVQWAANGVIVADESQVSDSFYNSQIIADGSGGAIMVWTYYRENLVASKYEIWAQRINNAGKPLWVDNGVCLYSGIRFRGNPRVISDGSGGAIIAWEDQRSGPHYDIYAQHINGFGYLMWGDTGVPISSAPLDQVAPKLISDGSGGAIITWNDSNRFFGGKIFAQRVSSVGEKQWTTDGVPICDLLYQGGPQIISDGEGGAIISWMHENSIYKDIYAQKINRNGILQWSDNGVAINETANDKLNIVMMSDGSGGAIIAWTGYLVGEDIFAQKVNNSGTVLWGSDGVTLSSTEGRQFCPKIISDGSGGAIITWASDNLNDENIYAQRVSPLGQICWIENGIPVYSDGLAVPVIISDGSGGAIISWYDWGEKTGVYSQRVNGSGILLWGNDGTKITHSYSGRSIPSDVLSTEDGKGGVIISWIDQRINAHEVIYAQNLRADGK